MMLIKPLKSHARRALLSSPPTWATLALLAIPFYSMASFNAQHHDIYVGDINGDGYDDLYLSAKKHFVPIASEVMVPLWITATPNYQLLSHGAGGFSQLTEVADGQVRLESLKLSQPIVWRDIDKDGVTDAEITQQGTMPDGIVFLGNKLLTEGWRQKDKIDYQSLNIKSFKANRQSIKHPYQLVTLTWEVTGADSVRIVDELGKGVVSDQPLIGRAQFRSKAATRYRLLAHNQHEQVSRSIDVHLEKAGPKRRWINNAQLQPAFNQVQAPIPSSIREDDQGNYFVSSLNRNYYKIDSTGRIEWVMGNLGIVSHPASSIDQDWLIGVQNSDRLPNLTSDTRRCSTNVNLDLLQGGKVLRIDPNKSPSDDNHNIIWSFETQYPVVSPPIFDPNTSYVYATDYCGIIYVLDAYSGEEVARDQQALKDQVITQAAQLQEGRLIVKGLSDVVADMTYDPKARSQTTALEVEQDSSTRPRPPKKGEEEQYSSTHPQSSDDNDNEPFIRPQKNTTVVRKTSPFTVNWKVSFK